MAKPKQYILSDLRTLWEKYISITGIRMLVNGKWQYNFDVKHIKNIDAARAEICMLKDVMTFPKYLETLEKNGK